MLVPVDFEHCEIDTIIKYSGADDLECVSGHVHKVYVARLCVIDPL
jgi:hypothetical protein